MVSTTGAINTTTSSAIQDIVQQHIEDMEALKKQMEKKVAAYKQASSLSSQDLSSTQVLMLLLIIIYGSKLLLHS